MNLHELGQRLKTERENQGYTLDDVYERIKISPSSIEHIEHGEVDDLPHPVYAKGFIKHYAEFLGLDGDELSREFARIMSMEEAGLDEHEAEVESDEFAPSPGGGARKWTMFSVLATVVLLAVLGWLVYDIFVKPAMGPTSSQTGVEDSSGVTSQPGQGQTRSGAAPGNETATREESLGQTAALKATDKEQTDSDVVTEAANGSSGLGKNLAGLEGETTESLNQTEQSTSLNQTGQTAEAANQTAERTSLPGTEEQLQGPSSQADPLPPQPQQTAQSDKQVLEISSVEACWLSADVDNRSKDIYLRPGESITFRFDETLKIKLGNAGGVKLRFNGDEVPLDARSGDVKTLTFP